MSRILRLAAIGLSAVAACGCNVGPGPLPTGTSVGLQPIADGLTAPVKVVAPPDGSGRLFVVDQIGRIRIIDALGNLKAEPFLDVSDRMTTLAAGYDERGLLGLAFHPDYP